MHRGNRWILGTFPESTLRLMTPRNEGKVTRKELRHIINACGVELSLKLAATSPEAPPSYDIRAPAKTTEDKQNQVRSFLVELAEEALLKKARLTKKEVDACWKILPAVVNTTSQPLATAVTMRKSLTPTPHWLFLTPASTLPIVLDRLGGDQSPVFPFIAKHFQGLRPQVVDGRIAIDQDAIDHMLIRFPNVIGTLSSCFLAFTELAERGPLNATNLEQTLTNVTNNISDGLTGIIEYTKAGKKIDLTDIRISTLDVSPYFEPVITQRTSEEDPTYTPNQLLLFRKKDLLHMIKGERNKFLDSICKRAGKVSIIVSSMGFQIKGPLDQVTIARDYLIKFGTLIAERSYKQPAQLDLALRYIFGEIVADDLPQFKSTNDKVGSKDVKSDLAGMSLLKLEHLSPNQEKYLTLLTDDAVPCLLTHGPAGTGKTRLFLQTAMQKIFDHYSGKPNSPFHKLIISMPLVTVGGRDLGAVPGDIFKKTEMWFDTYYSHLTRILSPLDAQREPDLAKGAKNLEQLLMAGIIEIAPLEFLRGKSFAGALVALDEAQNATPEQMRTFLTRAETTSRLFTFGDPGQFDRRPQYPETFFVPSTVSINDRGMVSIDIHGDTVNLGFHSDIGLFKLSADGKTLDTFAPNNGFVKALIIYSASQRIRCTHLDKSDIHRNAITFDILALEEEFRATSSEMGSRPPSGEGNSDRDPHHALGHAYKEAHRDNTLGYSDASSTLPKPTLT